jgi:hypothetical protein
LFWYVRNSLYFDLGLDRREDVLLASYDELVADPEGSMRRLCEFISFPYRVELSEHVERRTTHDRRPLAIDPEVRSLCDAMALRLEQALHPTPGRKLDDDSWEGSE